PERQRRQSQRQRRRIRGASQGLEWQVISEVDALTKGPWMARRLIRVAPSRVTPLRPFTIEDTFQSFEVQYWLNLVRSALPPGHRRDRLGNGLQRPAGALGQHLNHTGALQVVKIIKRLRHRLATYNHAVVRHKQRVGVF